MATLPAHSQGCGIWVGLNYRTVDIVRDFSLYGWIFESVLVYQSAYMAVALPSGFQGPADGERKSLPCHKEKIEYMIWVQHALTHIEVEEQLIPGGSCVTECEIRRKRLLTRIQIYICSVCIFE